jgi:leishmanolysin-like peptidase
VDNVQRSLILPDDTTMKFSQSEDGQRYAAIVTPKVRAVARNQFDCPSLEGAKLENQPTGSDSCTGDHWDEHDYYPEALSGVISPTTNILSHLTLALMEDTGWYRANYTQGGMSPWGLGAGCDFVNKPCLTTDSSGDVTVPEYSKGYFCTDQGKRGCSPALTHKLACTVVDDFCPLFGSTFAGLDPEQLACDDTKNADSLNIYR